MAKNIVICSDGTGNSSVKNRGTNVFKLFEALDLQAPDTGEEAQIAFYDDGVGTETIKPLKLIGGAFGYGLSKNVRELYLALARVYAPDDSIYLFGFSRGAYTARFLAGLILSQGIPVAPENDADLKKCTAEAFRRFRKLFPRKWYMSSSKGASGTTPPKLAKGFQPVKIAFVGVWDTVDAVGFPVDEVADFWDHVVHPFKFPELDLSASVGAGRHAVAIDDERQTFHPVMWNDKNGSDGRPADHVKQLWFSGAHSNVGGGYPKQGMSLVALDWMMQEAEDHGLRFLPSVRNLYRDLRSVNDKLYDSRAGLSVYYRYKPRPVRELCQQADTSPHIHVSVIERIALGTEGYAPGNLPPNLEVVWDAKPKVAEKLTQVLRSALATDALAPAQRWEKWKKRAQLAFVALSVAIAGYMTWAAPGGSRIEAVSRIFFSIGGFFEGLKTVATGAPWLPAALVPLLFFNYLATARIGRIYTEFWFPLRPKLRKLLLGNGQTKSAAGD